MARIARETRKKPLQNAQFFRSLGQISLAIGGQIDHVLDADAELAGQVDTGLDGHDGARRNRAVPRAAEVRILVDLDAHAVAQAVAHFSAVTGGHDDVISRLEGTTCGMRRTSCPDQLAQALKQAKA